METNKCVQKYPKELSKAETTLLNKHKNKLILNENFELSQKYLRELDKSVFGLAGAYPYLFDVLNYICTHHINDIQRVDDEKETHYRVSILWDFFLNYAMDGYTDSGNNKRLKKELYKLVHNPQTKMVPLDNEKSLLTQLVRVDIEYEDEQCNRYKHLKNISGKSIKGIYIEFYKLIWKALLSGDHGQAWFLAPKAFYAKMNYAISKYQDLREFNKYGNFFSPNNYRRLFLYLNMHDNKKGDYITCNAVDMMRSCLPDCIKENKYGEYTIRNWNLLHKFIQTGLLLISIC